MSTKIDFYTMLSNLHWVIFIAIGFGIAAPAKAQFQFVENAEERGIDFVEVNGSPQKDYIVEAKGAGVAVADVNGDGWDDIYLVNGAFLKGKVVDPPPRHRLFLNKGDGTFRDATDESRLGDTGFGTGAFFADIDNDGDLDCYLTNYGPNQLYCNDGKGKFTRVDNAGGAQNNGWSTGAAFADITGDGFLDLYVAQYAEFSTEIADKMGTFALLMGEPMFIGPSSFKPADDNLFINNGDGTFHDETQKRGINTFEPGRGFTVHFSDLDNDSDLDIYVANDTTSNNLYQNGGKGFFEDAALVAGSGLSDAGKEQGSMGVAIRDVDGDGDLDIVVANYHREYNILYRNEGAMQFTDATFVHGVGQGTMPMVSFGMLLEDYNNDSWADMYVSNGHVYPKADKIASLDGYMQKAVMLYNKGKGFFENFSNKMGPAGDLKAVSRGSATADFDHDGDLDIVVNNLDGSPFFLENRSPCGNWLQIAIQDERGMPAYGARLIVETGDRKQLAELYSSDSFLSQSSATLHFGLGQAETITRLWIRWPDGKEKELKDVRINQRMAVRKEK